MTGWHSKVLMSKSRAGDPPDITQTVGDESMDNKPHLLTPDEAKKKICLLSMGGLLMVHDAVMASEHECHGPDCMAWRWAEHFSIVMSNGIVTHKNSVGYSTTHGYCGLVK